MKRIPPQAVVYILGLAPLGLFYAPLKEALGGGAVFLAATFAYLVFLRAVAWFAVRHIGRRSQE